MDVTALVELSRAQWYDAVQSLVGAMVDAGDTSPDLAQARRLAQVAHRVMVLDAEDFHELASGRRTEWTRAVAACAFPHQPREPQRGALASLVPLYELMLEVVELRARRGEPQALVVTAHLIGEYLCQLGWEQRLGHGGDPLLMRRSVGQRWGTDDPLCPHSSAMRSTARRSLNAAHGDQPGFTRYLDKFHSRLGDTLAVCAMNHDTIDAGDRPDVGLTCPNPCSWVLHGTLEERRDLDARMRLALQYLESPVVALRHHAPVGHFFGVPSTAEISAAWLNTWQRLTEQWNDGSNPLVEAIAQQRHRPVVDEALPGLALLVSVVAGREIRPGHLLRDIEDDLVAALERWGSTAGA